MELSDREKEIVKLIVNELDCREIAATLKLSVHTVQTHRKNIFKKIQAKSLVGVVNYAYANQLVPCPGE